MFNDIWIARKSALSLARSLMVATMVIAIGTNTPSSPPKITTARTSSSTNTTLCLTSRGLKGPLLPSRPRARAGIEPARARWSGSPAHQIR
jgi:hypothetical protein